MVRKTGGMSFKVRWLIWRSRFSIPAWLARTDERKVVAVTTAVHGGLAILGISLFAWLCDLPMVFPALGPTVFILFTVPFSPEAAPRSIVLGHLTGIVVGGLVWLLMSYLGGQEVSLAAGGWPMLCSASLALAVTCLALVRLSCPHPPACASALVIALGGVSHWTGLLYMAAAVILVTALTVCINRIVHRPVPGWSPRDPAQAATEGPATLG